jgi:hypothetical protein
MKNSQDVTELLVRWKNGERNALEKLFHWFIEHFKKSPSGT